MQLYTVVQKVTPWCMTVSTAVSVCAPLLTGAYIQLDSLLD